jgi:hypothetical protein
MISSPIAPHHASAITGAVIDLTCGNAVPTNARSLVGVLE